MCSGQNIKTFTRSVFPTLIEKLFSADFIILYFDLIQLGAEDLEKEKFNILLTRREQSSLMKYKIKSLSLTSDKHHHHQEQLNKEN